MALALALLAALPVAAAERQNIGRGVALEGDTLVVDEATSQVKVAVEPGWQTFTDDASGLLILSRGTEAGRAVRVLDRRGRELGTVTAPPGWLPVPTTDGVVLVPQALHAPVRPHRLRFLSYRGETRREVEEPSLVLRTFQPARGGRFVTVSAGAEPDAWVVLVYDARGAVVWRQAARSATPPDAVLTADGRRLVIVERDVEGIASLSVFAPDRRLKRHSLPGVAQLVADPGSSRVAAVGQRTVAVLDASSGKLAWRRDEPLDFVAQGGVRFDRRGTRLLVVTADRDRAAGKARLVLRNYRLTDGDAERSPLGETPVDEPPIVVDAEVMPGGERRVTLPDRAITTAPGAVQ